MELLQYRAGPAALARIRAHGLAPEHVHAMFLPAVGPRWLIWAGVDRALIESGWLAHPARRCLLMGASIGSWRSLSLAARDPLRAHEALLEHYCAQHFTRKDSPRAISGAYADMLGKVFDDADLAHALAHPSFDLAIVAARFAPPGAAGPRWLQASWLGSAGLLNVLHPRANALFFRRVIFASRAHRLLAAHAPLTQQNARAVALASGTVPLYMHPVQDIANAPAGAYIDGGLTDYHVHTKLRATGGVVLSFLHQRKLLAAWLDRFTPWRQTPAAALEDLLLVYPDPEFVRSLPGWVVPSRDDFERYVDRPEERFARWREAAARARELGAAFMHDVASGAIAGKALPL
jgi:hypothetical protein